jgi:NAD(P)-dependent dehydrogenase (short-subunit alcohol dehydrogenase family)
MHSLSGKIIIVTGGNSGIGYYGIAHFLSLGATVVMASRSEVRATEAINRLNQISHQGKVVFIPLDLMQLSSVTTFVNTFKKQFDRLDILVNNAGIMFGKHQLTVDGFEAQMATNHFGHFALTGKLLPLLIQTEGRIVNISSIAHRRGEMDLKNLHYQAPKSYSPWGAYSRSKLANLLFTYELDRRLKSNSIPVKVLAAHPGVSKTKLLFKEKGTQPLFNFFKHLIPLQSAKQGAIPLIEAALNPDVVGGEYFGPNGLFEFGGKHAKLVKSTPLSHDKKLGQIFFDLSSELTKTDFLFKLHSHDKNG